MRQRFGASPEEWAHFDLILGLGEHLLPVVSNPHAEISPQSNMAALGKTPSHYNASRKVAGIPKWTEKRASEAELSKWAREEDYGICIQSRAIRAFDIDIDDPQLCERVERPILSALAVVLPARIRAGSGKRLLAFRLAGEFPKRSFRLDGGLVEFLADGQQFIAAGTHPSGARYEWREGLPDAFPEIAAEDFEQVWQALVSEFATAPATGGVVRRRGEAIEGKDDPVADWLLDKGLALGEGRDGALYVDCPWKDEHSSDSGITEAAWFPAGTNGYDRGGFRCLHAHCDGRTAGEFEQAIGFTAEEFSELVEPEDTASREVVAPGFDRDKNGQAEATLDNVMKAVEAPEWTGTDFAYDEFFGSIVLARHGTPEWRPLEDADYVALRRWLERRGFKPIGRELIRDAVLGVAWHNRFDSAARWIEGLSWDGVPRVETMLVDFFAVEDTPYARAVARYWLTAHAGRVLDPGCQADMVPVLVGPQNAGKSSACAALSPTPNAYLKIDLDHKDADLSRRMRGKLIGELDELRGFKGRTAEANKAWITQRFEEWTPKYQEFATKLQRRLVFVGTSNPDDFLDDPTGERRWLPFRVGTIAHAKLAAARDQLWAEGAALWRANGVEWQAAYDLAKAVHADFKAQDTWSDAVLRWAQERIARGETCDKLQIETIAIEALGLSAAKLSKVDDARLRKVLHESGFSQSRPWGKGPRPRLWSLQSTPVQQPNGLELC